jgi:secernin
MQVSRGETPMLQSCDTMTALAAATADGQTLFAKNSDRAPNECQPLVQHPRRRHPPGSVIQCHALEIPQVAETFRHVGSRPYWCWGYEHGFNEHQVVIGNEGLGSWLEHDEPKLLGMELLRLGLERGRSAAEAVEVMTGLITRYGQGQFDGQGVVTYDNGFIVADPREAYVIETAGHYWAVQQVRKTAGISNIYSIRDDWDRLSEDAEEDAARLGLWDRSRPRFDFADAFTHGEFRGDGLGTGRRRRARSCAVLQQRAGGVDVATMMALLSDHSDGARPEEPFRTDFRYRGGICVHANEDGTGGNTAASLVADLCADGSRLPVYWCSFYSPCLGVFFPVFSEGALPPVLAAGGGELDDESPWWLFHRLNWAVRADPDRRVPEVRQRWAEMQADLLASAYSTAREGKRLLDCGETEAAELLLTGYTAQSVDQTLAAARDMLRSMARDLASPAAR